VGAVAGIFAAAAGAQQVPDALRVPANEQLVVQLFDNDGKTFGKHFAGPSWEASDGSRAVGKAAANAPSPDANSIPWLLVKVVSHEGHGVLTPVTSIQRINTKGGKASATGCDAGHAGQEVRVAYSADYLFFAPK
jgi:hypothetical protein